MFRFGKNQERLRSVQPEGIPGAQTPDRPQTAEFAVQPFEQQIEQKKVSTKKGSSQSSDLKDGSFTTDVLTRAPIIIAVGEDLEQNYTPTTAFINAQALAFDKLQRAQIVEMSHYRMQDLKGNRKALYIKEVQKRNDEILKVVEQNRHEKLKNYGDRFPFLDQRRALMRLRINVNLFARQIIDNPAFENITITIILLNSATLVAENPADETPPEMVIVDRVFLGLYTFEMVLKILGMGFIFNSGAYLRSFWGLLDFTIVVSAYFTLAQELENVDMGRMVTAGVDDEGSAGNLNALRAFRVLRPLRTITSIKGLRVLVTSVMNALPMMKQTVLVLFFFFLIFAIAGVQLLSGVLKRRCVSKLLGTVMVSDGEEKLCGGLDNCPDGFYCGKGTANLNENSSLDNIFYALLMIFQCTTLEGWSDIQTLYQRSYGFYIWGFFVLIVFIGAFFLMNLTLAVVNASFTKSQNESKNDDKEMVAQELQRLGKSPKADNFDGEMNEGLQIQVDDIVQNTEIGLFQFIIAKKYARKMITFLRLRQAEKYERKQKQEFKTDAKTGDQNTEIPFGATARQAFHKNAMLSQVAASNSLISIDMDHSRQNLNLASEGQLTNRMNATQANFKPIVPLLDLDGPNMVQNLMVTDREVEQEADLTGHVETVRQFLTSVKDHKGEQTERCEMLRKSTAQLWSPQQISLASINIGSPALKEFCNNQELTRRDMASDVTRIKNIADHSVNLSVRNYQESQVDRLRMTGFQLQSQMSINNETNSIDRDSLDLEQLDYDKLVLPKVQKQETEVQNNTQPDQMQSESISYHDSLSFIACSYDQDSVHVQDEPQDKSRLNITQMNNTWGLPPCSIVNEPNSQLNSLDLQNPILLKSFDSQQSVMESKVDSTWNLASGSVDVRVHSISPVLEDVNHPKLDMTWAMPQLNEPSQLEEDSQLQVDSTWRHNLPDEDAESVVNSDNSLNRSIMDFRQSKFEWDKNKMVKEVPELTAARKEVIRMMLMKKMSDQRSRTLYRTNTPLYLSMSPDLITPDEDYQWMNQMNSEQHLASDSFRMGEMPGNNGTLSMKRNKSKLTNIEIQQQKIRDFRRNFNEETNKLIEQKEALQPYAWIDGKMQKVVINHGVNYKSTSQDEVLERRIFGDAAKRMSAFSKFISKPQDPSEMRPIDMVDMEDFQHVRPLFFPKGEPYRQKTVYRVHNDDEWDESEDDEISQPFETVMQVAYKDNLRHLPTKFLCRRSDILVSSTLSFTLCPIEEKTYQARQNLASLTDEERDEWIHSRQKFLALKVIHQKLPKLNFTPAYYTSRMRNLFKRHDYTYQNSAVPTDVSILLPTKMVKFKSRTQNMTKAEMNHLSSDDQIFLPKCLLREPLTPEQQQNLGEEEKRIYNIQKAKYSAVNKNGEKQGPAVAHTLNDARRMRAGVYHEDDGEENQDDEDEGRNKSPEKNQVQTKYILRDDDFKENLNLHDFEKAARKICKKVDNKVQKNIGDEIPKHLRDELDLPVNMGKQDVDFGLVRSKDCQLNRKIPFWSGQDVLEESLNLDKSLWVVNFINETRVWPKGFYGVVKKGRCLLKQLVKSAYFDNFMLLSVLLNTVSMASERYGMTQDEKDLLEWANVIFTWIFIIEMTVKLLAIGFKKYCTETMNIIDGSVVLISIVEIVMSAGVSSGSNFQAFRTVRIFRTIRVVRVTRLLRALHSMQVIMGVISRSFDSFMYIAMLLFVCCFIFSLLGKTLFGNKFNFDPKPRGNFDSFNISFVTVFQVLTMENWQLVAFDAMRGEMGKWVPAAFFIVWIFIGNFILLNLFLAILLDAFLVEDEDCDECEEMLAKRKAANQKKHHAKEKLRIHRLKKISMSLQNSKNLFKIKESVQVNKSMTKSSINGFRGLIRQDQNDWIVDNVEDLSPEAIRNMFLDIGVLKDKTNERKKMKMYEGVDCECSFYVFAKSNVVRTYCYNLQTAKWFDNTIMILIALNSVKLAADTYFVQRPDTDLIKRVIFMVDDCFNILFTIECLIKCLSLGFFLDNGSYLRDNWNRLDFFIVVTSLTDMMLTKYIDADVFKILRLLRTLRPLRVISHNASMKMIVAALFESVGSIFNVMIVVMMVWLMFAILAINLLAGKSFYCSIEMYKNKDKHQCNVAGGSWNRFDSNYDDIAQAMMTLFIVSTLEGWPDIMLQSIDATKVNRGPEYESNPGYVYFYIVFIMVGSFFLLNFFIGVLFLKYTEAQRAENKGYTEDNKNWIAIQDMITKAKVAHDKLNMPDDLWRYRLWKLANSKPFEQSIMAFIILNMLQMALDYEGKPASISIFLQLTNYIFTVVFLAECILKLLVYGWSYFHESWNKFDFFVVCASLIDLGLEFVDDMEDLPIGNIAKILRVLRVLRVVRLASRSKDLQALLQTISMSITALFNVLGLVLLILFMFAVLGVFFFGELTEPAQVIDPDYKNFRNFGRAYLLLFAIATGEDWNRLMYDCIDSLPYCEKGKTCGSSYAPVYYISFIMVITHVMLNLFILVIIQQFEKYYVAEDNPIKTFTVNFDMFHEVWVKYTYRFKCVKLRERDCVDFFQDLPQPMGFRVNGGESDEQMVTLESDVKREVLKLGIRKENGFIYFNELLYRSMRRVYGNFKLNKKMQLKELKTQFRIFVLTENSRPPGPTVSNEEVYANLVNHGNSVNPFLTVMYYRISFNSWLNATRRDRVIRGTPFNVEKPPELIDVYIEVSETFEYTSSENEEESTPQDDQEIASSENQKVENEAPNTERKELKLPKMNDSQKYRAKARTLRESQQKRPSHNQPMKDTQLRRASFQSSADDALGLECNLDGLYSLQ